MREKKLVQHQFSSNFSKVYWSHSMHAFAFSYLLHFFSLMLYNLDKKNILSAGLEISLQLYQSKYINQ